MTRKCEDICKNDVYMLVRRYTAKNDFEILISVCEKIQVSWLGSFASRAKKIDHMEKFFGVSCVTSRICLINIRRKSRVLLFLARKDPFKSSEMTSWHQNSAKMTPHGQDFAWKCARYAIFGCFSIRQTVNTLPPQKKISIWNRVFWCVEAKKIGRISKTFF